MAQRSEPTTGTTRCSCPGQTPARGARRTISIVVAFILVLTPFSESATPLATEDEKPTPSLPSRPVLEACPMCVMPKNISHLQDFICKAGFVMRTRLSLLGQDDKSNNVFLGLRDYRELKPSRPSASIALHAWEGHARQGNGSEKAPLTPSVLVLIGSRGECSCKGRVNNRDLYLLAGKYSKHRGQLVIRQTKSLLLPWREVKRWFRQLKPLRKPLRCSK